MTLLLLVLLEFLLVAGVIVSLHALQHRIGLAPLYVFIGSNQYLQAVLAATLYVPLLGEVAASPGSMVLFSSSLFAILLVYIKEDIPRTRTLITGLVVSNLTLTALSLITMWQVRLGAINVLGIPQAVFEVDVRVFVVGTMTLVFDTVLIVIAYEFLCHHAAFLPPVLRIVGALVGVLTFDAVAFCVGSFGDSPLFARILVGNLAGKLLSGTLYGTALYLYLVRTARRDSPGGTLEGGMRTGEAGVFGILTYRQRYEMVREQRDALRTEVAERERREEILRASEERYRQLTELSPDGVVVHRGGPILFANTAAARLLGVPDPAALVGLHVDGFVPGEAAVPVEQGKPGQVRTRRARAGGGRFVEVEIVSVGLPFEGQEAVQCVLRDATEKRRLERLRDDLTHTLVHDLRDPLTGIMGALELLEIRLRSGSAPPADTVSLLDVARRSGDLMLEMVRSILDLSRLEEGRMPLEPRQVRLHAAVAECLEMQAPAASPRAVQLRQAVPPDLVAWADPSLLARVLQNLVGNAAAFAPSGGWVRVEASPDPARPGGVVVSVSDNGPGIPPEMQDRLFQKFETRKRGGRGTGLGLVFCRLAVEAHGGRIQARSEPGGGAVLSFSLPPPPRPAGSP